MQCYRKNRRGSESGNSQQYVKYKVEDTVFLRSHPLGRNKIQEKFSIIPYLASISKSGPEINTLYTCDQEKT